MVARGKAFEEDFLVVDINADRVFNERLHDPRARQDRLLVQQREPIVLRDRVITKKAEKVQPLLAEPPGKAEEVYRALVLGTQDYVRKNGFQSAVIGLSGGIDSALVACVATDAMGAENVTKPGTTSNQRLESIQR